MPSDEKIERVARAIYETRGAHEPPRAWRKWGDIGGEARAVWCRCAVAALAFMECEGEAKPVAWRACFINSFGQDVWHFFETKPVGPAGAQAQPLYASPRPEAVGEAVKAERERCAWIADNFDYNSVECDHYNLMPLGYKICEGIAAAIMAGEEDKG